MNLDDYVLTAIFTGESPEIEPCDDPDCDVPECLGCGIRDCPGKEPLHYHHDGCPWCFYYDEYGCLRNPNESDT